MKALGIVLLLVGLFIGFMQCRGMVVSGWEYSTKYSSSWKLSEKASTIAQKAEYMDKFVTAIETNRQEFASNASLIFFTPNQSFDENLKALKSLSIRLDDIKKMNPSSFEYNTAIQQITAQGQGEAGDMLTVLHDCWIKGHYWYLYHVYGGSVCIVWILLSIVGFSIFMVKLANE